MADYTQLPKKKTEDIRAIKNLSFFTSITSKFFTKNTNCYIQIYIFNNLMSVLPAKSFKFDE